MSHTLDLATASRFAKIALGHVTREYPNAVAHVPPKSVHPIFYGSYDWHSCVHSYWLLATLYRLFPEREAAARIRTLFMDAFTKRKIAGECAYLKRKSEARRYEQRAKAILASHRPPEGSVSLPINSVR